MKKIVTLLYETFILDWEHLGKDVLLFGSTLAKKTNLEYELVCVNSTIDEKVMANNKIIRLSQNKYIKDNLVGNVIDTNKINRVLINEYLEKEAKNIDFLILFHCCHLSELLAKKYKKLNKHGVVILKTDSTSVKDNSKSKIKRIYHKYIKKIFNTKYADLITMETKYGFNNMCKEGIYGQNVRKKLMLIPNGFEKEFEKIERIPIELKNNTIISVGRIGTMPKNNELLLAALKKVNIGNWRVKFVGPYTKDFKEKLNNFIQQNQQFYGKIELVGAVYDKKELANIYNKSKVFVLTSNYESFGLVLAEALYFNNYLISTQVGVANEIICEGKFGVTYEVGNSDKLAVEINRVISTDVLNKLDYNEMSQESAKYSWDEVITPLAKWIVNFN